MFPFIIKTTGIYLAPEGRAPIEVPATHANYEAIKQALRDGDEARVLELAEPETVKLVNSGRVRLDASGLYLDGKRLDSYMAQQLVRFAEEGLPVNHLVAFVNNLYNNPSRTAVEELYLFLEAARLPITEDGHFLAYKTVRSDFKDKHSGTFDNSPGKVCEEPRNTVDEDRNRTCSNGLHAASYNYARNSFFSYGDRLVVVKINPADVVTIPRDYNNEKLRCCRYEVLYEVSNVNQDVLTDTAIA
jgi:hypothetical protein